MRDIWETLQRTAADDTHKERFLHICRNIGVKHVPFRRQGEARVQRVQVHSELNGWLRLRSAVGVSDLVAAFTIAIR